MQLQWYYFASLLFIAFTLWIFKSKNHNQRFKFLMVLAAINALAYVINWYYFYIRSDHILTLLPLQLCNLAVFLIPTALITKKAVIMDFVFYVCGLAALVAIFVVGSDYQDTYSMMTLSFYIFHFSIFLIPMLNSVWGFHSLKPTRKSAIDLTIMVLAISFSLHLFNLFLNNVFDIPANYFFTIKDLAAPTNPAFALFASWIPYDYIYLTVAFPILYLYMFLIYLFMRFTSKYKTVNTNHKTNP